MNKTKHKDGQTGASGKHHQRHGHGNAGTGAGASHKHKNKSEPGHQHGSQVKQNENDLSRNHRNSFGTEHHGARMAHSHTSTHEFLKRSRGRAAE